MRSAEQFVAEMACLQGPPPGLIIRNGSVYTRTKIAKGTRYGPFIGRFSDAPPQNERFGWEASKKKLSALKSFYWLTWHLKWMNTANDQTVNNKKTDDHVREATMPNR